MPLNKIQLKAEIFRIINPIRNLNAVDDKIISSTLYKLKSIKDADFEFIARILIKEADTSFPKAAGAFLHMAENLSPESFIPLMFNELNSPKTSDARKIFFLNALSGFGVKFDPEDIGEYLNNPDEVINNETLKFLENAKSDPEAQIDFLDFYFTSGEEDKRELINSVVHDFEGDELINILSPLVLSEDDISIMDFCLDIMQKQKSLMSIKPLKYLTNLDTVPEIKSKAHKILQKMTLQGFYTKEKLSKFYKELLSDFNEPSALISLPDGNSNFSVAISRKTKTGACFVFFTAVNIELGPFSAFGFSSLTESDYNLIIKRFFNLSQHFSIPPKGAKTILNSLLVKRIALNKIVPYEYYPWERLLDDIETDARPLDEMLVDGIEILEIDKEKSRLINNSPFFENWFYRYSKNAPYFVILMNKVLKLNKNNIQNIENLILETLSDKSLISNIKNRLKFLSYCLNAGGLSDLASLHYSVIFNEKEFTSLVSDILKRSIYEFALILNTPKKTGNNMFKKTLSNIEDKNKASLIINYIEENWLGNGT